MIDQQSLLSTARLLIGAKMKGAPNQTRLRRAVSTAYYALFHAITRRATDSFVGARHRDKPRYELVYRGFQHRTMKLGCEAVDKPALGAKASKAMGANSVSQDIRDIASAFVTLQDKRHWADYSPMGRITRAEATDVVDTAELAIRKLSAANAEELRNFLAYLLMDVRA